MLEFGLKLGQVLGLVKVKIRLWLGLGEIKLRLQFELGFRIRFMVRFGWV